MRLFLLTIAILISISLQAQVKEIPLCGEWRFVADSADYSCVPSVASDLRSSTAGLPAEAMVVNVPHTYNIMEGAGGLCWTSMVREAVPDTCHDERATTSPAV